MHNKIINITNEIGQLIDLQTELVNKRPLHQLAPCDVDDYHTRRHRIGQLCSDLTRLNSYDEA
jgi:hypothetical protein